MSKLELEVAWRYLRSRRGSRLLSFITLVAVGGVIVGVSALVIITAVMDGLQYEMREKILVGSPSIRITTYGVELRMPRWRETMAKVTAHEGVASAAPFVMTQALVKRQDRRLPQRATVYGMPQNATDSVLSVSHNVVAGSFNFRAPDGSPLGVVLGDSLAARLRLAVGDTMHLIGIGSLRQVGGEWTPPEPFLAVVNGLFHSGMYDYDNEFMYVDMSVAQRIAALGDAVTGIEVRTTNRWASALIARDLGTVLDPNVYNLQDWQTQNGPLFSALRLQKLAMTIVVLLIVVVAAFNIVSTLTMLVHDKTREIGILRTMGLHASSVRRIFFAQGVFIGIVGTAIGLAIGLAISTSIGTYKLIPLSARTYYIDHLPARTEPWDVVLIAVGGIVVALLATILPSAQAANLYPLEAIQRE